MSTELTVFLLYITGAFIFITSFFVVSTTYLSQKEENKFKNRKKIIINLGVTGAIFSLVLFILLYPLTVIYILLLRYTNIPSIEIE